MKSHKVAVLDLSDYLKNEKGFFVDPSINLKEFVNRFISKFGCGYITEKWLVQNTAKKLIISMCYEVDLNGSINKEVINKIINTIVTDAKKTKEKNKRSYTKFKNIDRKWREVRYKALKRDGAKCLCCGSTAKDGVKIHVDHIKPVSLFPMLKYDLDNLQVLCEVCNIGKSNLDDTDWR